MTKGGRSPIWRLAVRCVLIGLLISAALNLVVLFLPLPDAATEIVVALQGVGLWLEIRRATSYHMSAWNPFLINAALYALVLFSVLLLRARRFRFATPAA